jgi:hypothetical protein
MATSRLSTEQRTHIAQDGYAVLVQITKNTGGDQRETGGKRVRCTTSRRITHSRALRATNEQRHARSQTRDRANFRVIERVTLHSDDSGVGC